MSVYVMTLHQCDGTSADISDPAPYESLDAARAAAVRLARSIMIDEISHGRLCLTCWIVIKNEDGHGVMTVPFGEAIELLDHPACDGPPRAAPAAPVAAPRR